MKKNEEKNNIVEREPYDESQYPKKDEKNKKKPLSLWTTILIIIGVLFASQLSKMILMALYYN